ncbi:MAG: hypothetical protein WBJ17_00330 [Natronincolaceae bacterium]
MGIIINYEENMVYSIQIDDNEFFTEGDNRVIIPMSVLKNQLIKELPSDVIVELCDSIHENIIMIHNVPTSIMKVDSGKILIEFEETITRKYWDAPVGLRLWMEMKRDIISERATDVGDVRMDAYDDDGTWISLCYSSVVTVDSFGELFIYIDNLYNEIEGATDLALGSPFENIGNCKKESDFTVGVLLPLFRNLGFSNVRYNHGNREYGKDITFARRGAIWGQVPVCIL